MSAVQSEGIVFRAPRSEAELEDLMRLRYRVYYDHDGMRAFLTPNPHAIDLDAYDTNAHHVGLFRDDTPVGYARLITITRGPQAEWVESIARRHPGLSPQVQADAQLPVLNYAKHVINQAKDWLLGRGGQIVEASRLSLAAEHRSYRMGRFFAHALVSYWYLAGFDTAVVSVRVSHARMWKSIGFRVAPGTQEYDLKGFQANVLVLSRQWLPRKEQKIVYAMTQQFRRDGQMLAA
jgi:hypothetical protein